MEAHSLAGAVSCAAPARHRARGHEPFELRAAYGHVPLRRLRCPPLYASGTKFESGTGRPSFREAIENAVGTSTDRSFFMIRTEVHCGRCGGHLGQVLDDGSLPTGKQHCIRYGAAV